MNQNNIKKPYLFTNLIFLLIATLFILSSVAIQFFNLSFGVSIIFTQYFLFLLIPIIALKLKNVDLKEYLKIRGLSFFQVFLIIVITLCFYPLAVVSNSIFMFIFSLLGDITIPQVPTAVDVQGYFLYLFLIAFSAGVCEEFLFRGFLLKGYEGLGLKSSIIISSVLFGIFHFNIYNLGATIILGLVFAYIVIITKSIFAGIIGHILNNGIAVTLGFVINKTMDILNEFVDEDVIGVVNESASNTISTKEILPAIILFLIISMFTVTLGVFTIKQLKKVSKKRESELYKEEIVEDTSDPDEYSESKEALDIKEEKTSSENILISFLPILPIILFFLFQAGMQISNIN